MTDQDIKDFISAIRKQNKALVRVKGDKNNPPKKLSFNNTGVSVIPHLEVEYTGKTDIYEFEKAFNKSKLADLITKCIFLSIHAKKSSGDFFLVVDKKEKGKFEDMIRSKKLNVTVLTIP